jgi:hypothetical protein
LTPTFFFGGASAEEVEDDVDWLLRSRGAGMDFDRSWVDEFSATFLVLLLLGTCWPLEAAGGGGGGMTTFAAVLTSASVATAPPLASPPVASAVVVVSGLPEASAADLAAL